MEKIRERLVTQGFEIALNGKPKSRVRGKGLSTEIRKPRSSRCGWGHRRKDSRTGRLRLLAEQAVALEIVESVSHETVRGTLKKTA